MILLILNWYIKQYKVEINIWRYKILSKNKVKIIKSNDNPDKIYDKANFNYNEINFNLDKGNSYLNKANSEPNIEMNSKPKS